jgi:MHS family proline/betaine transporter-like MFS transporter
MILITLFGATAGQGVVWYTGQFYALSFIQNTCKVEFVQSYYIIAIALVIGTPLFIYFGSLSDRIGRKYIMMIGLLLAVLMYRPIYPKMYSLSDINQKTEITESYSITSTFSLLEGTKDSVKTTNKDHVFTDGSKFTESTTLFLNSDQAVEVNTQILLGDLSFWFMIALVFVQVVFFTMVYGPIAAFLVELFPTRIRYTSMSFPYHIGNGIFGGLTPLLATSLYEFTKPDSNPAGDPIAGLWYPIIVAAVCFVIGMFFLSNKVKGEVMEN